MKEREIDRDNRPLPDGPGSTQPGLPGDNGVTEEDSLGLIELTDVVEPIDLERKGPDADLPPDNDPFIDLTEAIDLDASPAVSRQTTADTEEETVMDLFQMVDDRHVPPTLDVSNATEADLIDLTDLTDMGAPLAPSCEGEPEGIIRLDDILNSERDAASPLFDLRKFSDSSPPADEETPVALTPAAIERAIDQIIQTRYGQTIEQMIAMIVEKVVLREMRTLKRSLMEDEDDFTG